MQCLIKSLFFICAVLLAINAVAAEEERTAPTSTKIRLICHAGLCKTGNTATRKLLYIIHEQLRSQGVWFQREDFHDEKNRLCDILRSNPDFLKDVRYEAISNDCHTVLFYSENLFMGINREDFWKEASKFFQVTMSLCVRDFYQLYNSMHQESCKNQAYSQSLSIFMLKSYERALDDLRFALGKKNSVFINYGCHKNNLLEAILEKNGMKINGGGIKPAFTLKANRSPTQGEWNILSAFMAREILLGDPWQHGYFKQSEIERPKAKPFRYYDAEADKVLYERIGDLPRLLNERLPPDEQLPTGPYKPEGYVAEWDNTRAAPEEIKTLIQYLKLENLYNKEKNQTYQTRKSLFPKDFDPYAFMADGHVLYLPKNLDPFQHFLEQERRKK